MSRFCVQCKNILLNTGWQLAYKASLSHLAKVQHKTREALENPTIGEMWETVNSRESWGGGSVTGREKEGWASGGCRLEWEPWPSSGTRGWERVWLCVLLLFLELYIYYRCMDIIIICEHKCFMGSGSYKCKGRSPYDLCFIHSFASMILHNYKVCE